LKNPFHILSHQIYYVNFADSEMLVTDDMTTTLLNWSDTIVKA